jgi:hypothetical protein
MLLILFGALAVTQVATAAAISRPTSAFAYPTQRDAVDESEEEFEGEEGDFELEECEAAADELEFEEEEEEEEEEEFEAPCGGEGTVRDAKPGGAPVATAPAACQVRQAKSTVTALPASDQVRLTIRYRTYAPTPVTIGLKLKDQKGSVTIERTTKHLGGRGVLHVTTRLDAAAMARALTASEFDVSLRAPETPGFCAGDLEQRLHDARHGATHQSQAPHVHSD